MLGRSSNKTPRGDGKGQQVQMIRLANGEVVRYDPAVHSTANGDLDNIYEAMDTYGVFQTLETVYVSPH